MQTNEAPKKYYAGVGSRYTPIPVRDFMTKSARLLEQHGYTLRSGGAIGADEAFAAGVPQLVDLSGGGVGVDRSKKQILRPKDTYELESEARKIAASIHPAWHACSDYAMACHARNVMQVLGTDLKTPVDFVVCWTQDGKVTGGTATAINLGLREKLPVYNLALPEGIVGFMDKLEGIWWEVSGARDLLLKRGAAKNTHTSDTLAASSSPEPVQS